MDQFERMDPCERFLRLLVIAGELTGRTVSKELLELYEGSLREVGYEALCKGLKRIIDDIKRFPTPAEIRTAAGVPPPPSPKDFAVSVAGEIIAAVAKFGGYRELAALAVISPTAVEVIRRSGGWTFLCDTLNEKNITTYQAQFRDMAAAVLANPQMELPPGRVPEKIESKGSNRQDGALDFVALAETLVGKKKES